MRRSTVLTALELIFTHDRTLSQHIASQLAKLLTHHSMPGVSGSEERDDRTSLALLEKMIYYNYYY